MNLFAPQHLIPILLILLLLFGRGRISEFMGDFAKGIKSFKKGLQENEDGEEEGAPVVKTIDAQAGKTVAAHSTRRKSTGKASASRSTKRKA